MHDVVDVQKRVTMRGRRVRRALAAGATAVTMTLLLTGCYTEAQNLLVKKINEYRNANGKTALAVSKPVMDKAQAWSQHMARTGVVEHTGGGSKLDTSGIPKWCAVAENVTKATSIEAAHQQFLASSVHRANILGPYNHVGTGAVKSGGYWWVTEIFYRSC